MQKLTPRLSRKEFLRELTDYAASLRMQVEAQVDGFNPDPKAQQERRARAWDDYGFFKRTYFPHYVQHANSLLHDYLDERLPAIIASPAGEHDAIAAPRGEAKSTNVSLIFVLWCLLTNRKHYVCIMMDAFDQAATMLEAVKVELESNPRLLMDFPDAAGQGRVWQAGVIVTRNNQKVQAFGSGKRMRGLRHGPYRPDLAIGDDLENDQNVASPEQRDKLERWLTRSVLRLGKADDSMDVIIIGTILHYDSVLNRLLKNPLWTSRRFQALVRWPSDMALWDEFEEVLRHDGKDAAVAFYEERKAVMDEGAIVSWPAGRPLLSLMIVRARDGHASFDSELQNDPLSDEDAPFAKCITFWVQKAALWKFYGACDPSLGKHGKQRDPSAILVGALNRETGVLDVVEAKIRKRLPDRIIEDVIALQDEYGCLLWGFEAVQFQEFLRTELVKRAAARGIPVPARPIIPNTDKELRIESLQPHMANGLIRVHSSQRALIEQLRHWPKADHDDGPDALHMLWTIAQRGMRGGRAAMRPGRRSESTQLLRGYS